MDKSNKRTPRITITIEDARVLGIIACTCGHPHNNHFAHDSKPCARCECKALDETALSRGEWS